MNEELLKELTEHIKEHEGYSQLVYDCPAGFSTIAYGRNLDTKGISLEEGEYLLKNDIDQAYNEVRKMIKDFDNLPIKAQLVLIDMTFNLGLGGLLKFENMLDAIECRDWEKASEELLDSRYAAETKRRARLNAAFLLSCSDA